MKSLIAVSLLLYWFGGEALAVEPRDCVELFNDELDAIAGDHGIFSNWSFPKIGKDVLYAATTNGENPWVTSGDFDNDRKKDIAFLIEVKGKKRLAVCLSMKPQKALFVDDLYCSDGIATIPKGSTYYDFETDSEGQYQRDGISTYCFEQAGATYLYEMGSFRRVVDSD